MTQIAEVPTSYTERRLRVARTARVGMLGDLSAATADLWVVLHGYGHLAASFAASARWPEAPDRTFLFPEALQRFYDAPPGSSHADTPVGASWMTREAREDDIADNHAYLDHVVRDAQADAPNAALTVLGFSQGAATAARWSEARARAKSAPARLIVWAGDLPRDVDLGPNSPLRDTKVDVVFGSRDRWISAERVEVERKRFADAGFPITIHTFEGGHRLDDETLERVGDKNGNGK